MATTLNEEERKRGVRRTVWLLVLIALAVYVGFIALSVMRGTSDEPRATSQAEIDIDGSGSQPAARSSQLRP